MENKNPPMKKQDLKERVTRLEKEIAELKRQLEEWQFPKWGQEEEWNV